MLKKDNVLKIHKKLKGKLKIELTDKLENRKDLSIHYTPGIAKVSEYLYEHPSEAKDYTWKSNNLAIISDGSAVLGLGNIGPNGALPVMEGKAMIFRQFGDINAVPIVLDVHDKEGIIKTIKAIAPSFGAINLEDIAAPICFEIEETLKRDLDIPVMHDDQHGTAVVVLAGLINALKLAHKDLGECKVVIVGVGAAGTAIAKLIKEYSPKVNLILIDSKGIISKDRKDLNKEKMDLLKISNLDNLSGDLNKAIKNADIFIGVSKPKLLTKKHIQSMNEKAIIFAMANPDPEIYPDEAKKAGAFIVATGRSDFPNQINNALAFPGIFRGALDNKIQKITDKHKIATAEVIAKLVKKPTVDKIVPDIFEANLVKSIAKVIK